MKSQIPAQILILLVLWRQFEVYDDKVYFGLFLKWHVNLTSII